MQTRIRIIKRATAKAMNTPSVRSTTKSERERERETVNTVKAWVADWHQRKVQLQAAAEAIIRSLEPRRDRTTQALARVP